MSNNQPRRRLLFPMHAVRQTGVHIGYIFSVERNLVGTIWSPIDKMSLLRQKLWRKRGSIYRTNLPRSCLSSAVVYNCVGPYKNLLATQCWSVTGVISRLKATRDNFLLTKIKFSSFSRLFSIRSCIFSFLLSSSTLSQPRIFHAAAVIHHLAPR